MGMGTSTFLIRWINFLTMVLSLFPFFLLFIFLLVITSVFLSCLFQWPFCVIAPFLNGFVLFLSLWNLLYYNVVIVRSPCVFFFFWFDGVIVFCKNLSFFCRFLWQLYYLIAGWKFKIFIPIHTVQQWKILLWDAGLSWLQCVIEETYQGKAMKQMG